MWQKIIGSLGAIAVGVVFPVIVFYLTEGQKKEHSDSDQSLPLPIPPIISHPPKPSESPPSSPVSPNKTIIDIELAELYSAFYKNYTQAVDVYKGMTVNASGFIRTDSIYECQFTNRRQITETTRCIKIFSSDGVSAPAYGSSGYEYQNLRFSTSQISQAVEINQMLYKTGKPLSVQVRGTILPSRNEFYSSGTFVLENWQIISYKPIE